MKWKTLQHNGIIFPPDYESRGITVKIKGQPVKLNILQEEMIYQWAKKKDTPYVKDAVFQKNFVADFAATFDGKYKDLKITDIDLSEAFKVVDKEKDARLLMSKEEKKALAQKRKEMREKMKAIYGKAILDGSEVEVANYMAEPPGIFIGRGDHPLRGKWKPKITHKDVTLNLGEDAKVPPGNWKKIVHEHDSMWLACWDDFISGKIKYVWLADTAGLKQERDMAKYDKAAKLGKEIKRVEEKIISGMKSKDPKISKIATVCYLIYRTSMRVGDEKDPDEADTVGATTLRKEHIKLDNGSIHFDFLGKDSVRWEETIKVEGNDMVLYDNLKKLVSNKSPKDEIFDGITSRHVNAFLGSIVKGMTAKVFRTYLATTQVKEYLKNKLDVKDKTENEKLYIAKMANLQAAMMCNHKRTIPKNFEETLQKKRETLKKLKEMQPKTEKQKERLKEREEKLKLAIDLAERTRDYNLGTSLRNYIDPRVFKAWTDEVKADWEKLYTASLQKKFLWVKNVNAKWKDVISQ
ncbi:DNA topoisomerase I [Candidatus Nitrosotenuis uzonensis]|uniref:DNA topoisomerase 1 n=1 Tax=Candidatus Nitrosotenuis uzonensis TaxID=1407055 RepID=A0A812F1T5_9ARCH|nr:DNA topoisomerase I [Candidatus Nitrosotenuis uzonensis]CAE6495977.1 2-alkenal reductase [Candidatus Nitrosotenuis uzonensis]